MSCNLDLLSEYLDGELTPPDRARMEDHLAVCSSCRSSLRLLSGVGEAFAPPPPDFAARVARKVLATPAPQAWWRRLFQPENPVAAMLNSRSLRRGTATVSWRAALALFALPALVFALPLLGVALTTWLDSDHFISFAAFTALGLLIGLPAWFLRSDVALLSALHRGRCLEEILTANVSPALIVDTLATHSVRAILRAALPVALVLLACCLPLEAAWRLPALGFLGLWLAGLVLLFFTLAYVMQAAATAGYMTQLGSWSRLGYLLLIPAWVPFLMSFAGFGWLRVPGWLLLVFVMRRAAIEGLRRSLLVRSSGRKPLRLRLVGAWTDNAIVVRETRRRSLFDGSLAAVVSLPFAWLSWVFAARQSWSHQVLVDTGWSAWWVLVPVSFVAAVARTLGAVTGEKERRTWEALVEAGFPRREFISGWLQLGILPVLVAQLPVYVLLTLLEWAVGGVSGLASLVFAGWLSGVVVTWAGAELGLALSAASSTSREAGTRCVACAAGLLVLWLVWSGVLFLVALGGAEFRWWNASRSEWADVVKYCLPVAALLLTSAVCLVVSRRVVASRLELDGKGAALGHLPSLGRWAAWLGVPAVATWFALCVDGGQGGMGTAFLAVGLALLAVSGPLTAFTRCAGNSLQGAALGFAAGGLLAGCSLWLHKLLTPYAVLAVFLATHKAYAFQGGNIHELLLLAPAVGAVIGMRMLSRQGLSWGEGSRMAGRRALPVLLVGGGLLGMGALAVERWRDVRVSDPALVRRLLAPLSVERSPEPKPDYSVRARVLGAFEVRYATIERKPINYLQMESQLPQLRQIMATQPGTCSQEHVREGLLALARWQGSNRKAAATWRVYLQACVPTTGWWSAEIPAELRHYVEVADLPEETWREWLQETAELAIGPQAFGQLMDLRFASSYHALKAECEFDEDSYPGPLDGLPEWYRVTMPDRFANQYLAARPQLYRLQTVSRPGELLGRVAPSDGMPYPTGESVNRQVYLWRAKLLRFEAFRVALEMRLYEKQHGCLPRGAGDLSLTRSSWMPDNTTIVLDSQGVTALTDTGPVTLYSFKVPARDE